MISTTEWNVAKQDESYGMWSDHNSRLLKLEGELIDVQQLLEDLRWQNQNLRALFTEALLPMISTVAREEGIGREVLELRTLIAKVSEEFAEHQRPGHDCPHEGL